jgi:hypothetical protein
VAEAPAVEVAKPLTWKSPATRKPLKTYSVSCVGYSVASGAAVDESQAVSLYREMFGINGTERCIAKEVK